MVELEEIAGVLRALDDDFYALQTLGRTWSLVESAYATPKGQRFGSKNSLHGQHGGSSRQTCGRSPKKRGCQALGRSKGGFGTKLHLLVDGAGRLLAVLLSPGQTSDHTYAPALVNKAATENLGIVMGDKGYDSDALRSLCSHIFPGHMHRSSCYLLSQLTNPEPRGRDSYTDQQAEPSTIRARAVQAEKLGRAFYRTT